MSTSQIVWEVVILMDPANPGTNNESFALYNAETRANETADALRRSGKFIQVRERRVV